MTPYRASTYREPAVGIEPTTARSLTGFLSRQTLLEAASPVKSGRARSRTAPESTRGSATERQRERGWWNRFDRPCLTCGGQDFAIRKDGRVCRPCRRRRSRERYRRDPDGMKRLMRRARLRKEFGLTEHEYDAMLAAQGHGCAICKRTCRSGRRLAIDHDHQTGRVRGLLCGRCNRGIGLLRDNAAILQSAADYLCSTPVTPPEPRAELRGET